LVGIGEGEETEEEVEEEGEEEGKKGKEKEAQSFGSSRTLTVLSKTL